jgi:PAS domain S-box-containing protein
MHSAENMETLNSIENLVPGDHLCCMYMTEEEHRAILTPFIRGGLEKGHKVFYVVDVRTAETVLNYLKEEGISIDEYLSSKQLVIADSRDTYIKEGRFDPDSMLALLGKETEKAVQEGFKALRVTGEMSWALRDKPGSERLMEYEGKLNQFFPKNEAIGLCQYDMRRFEPEVLLDVLATHPIAIVRNKCYDNMYYMPPDEFLGPNRAEAELKRRIYNLEERQKNEKERLKFENALQQSETQARREAEFTNAIFDNAGALILVLDKKGQIMRFNRTCEKLTGYSAQEVTGQNLWDLFIPEEDVQATRKVFRNLNSGQFPQRLENDWLTKEGGRIRVAWSNTCLLDEEGQVELIVSTGLDITEVSWMEKARKREFSTLQEYSGDTGTSVTASSLGIEALSKNHPQVFEETVAFLGTLLEQSIEQNIYKVNHGVSEKLRKLAEKLGNFHAGPRDLVQAYVQSIQEKTRDKHDKKARAYTEEGRLLLIELMGYLATYYYNLSLGRDNTLSDNRGSSS